MRIDPAHLSRRSFIVAALHGVSSVFVLALIPLRLGGALVREKLPWGSEVSEIVRKIKRPTIPRGVVEVALNSQNSDARPIIQGAIDDAAQKGGGRVVIPAGAWHIGGPLHLASGVELHLHEGARITFSDNPSDYLSPVFTRWEGTEAFSLSPFIVARNAHDVAITGRGIIDGNGTAARLRGMVTKAEDQETLRKMGESATPVAERIFGKGHALPPSLIQFVECQAVLVEGVRIVNMPFWGLHLLYSQDVTVRGVTIESLATNNDGIDIDSSRRVHVDQCTFTTGDDCIAVKSGRDLDGRRIGRASEDVVIQNCHMKLGHGSAVAIGSEMSGGVRNVYVDSCKMDQVSMGLHIKSNCDRGGYVEHIRMGRVVIDSCHSIASVTTVYHSYRGGRFVPAIRDILIEDVRCQRAKRGISLRGDSKGAIERFSARSVHGESVETPLVQEHVNGLVLEDVTMNGSPFSISKNGSSSISVGKIN